MWQSYGQEYSDAVVGLSVYKQLYYVQSYRTTAVTFPSD